MMLKNTIGDFGSRIKALRDLTEAGENGFDGIGKCFLGFGDSSFKREKRFFSFTVSSSCNLHFSKTFLTFFPACEVDIFCKGVL